MQLSQELKQTGANYDSLRPLSWNESNQSVTLIDQRMLPYKLEKVEIKNYMQMADAISDMVLRGAPLIGIAAAYGMALAAKAGADLDEADKLLRSTRPTAVNLAWALDQLTSLKGAERRGNPEIFSKILEKAHWILEDDIQRCKAMSKNGAEYIIDRFYKSAVSECQEQGLRARRACSKFAQANENLHNAAIGDQKLRILTICNAGALATGGYGTALGLIRELAKLDLVEMVYACETRPRQQGSRLTAWELAYENIPVTLISDNMVSHTMKERGIDFVITGADRIAANGDAANKIGTYGLAIQAQYHQVPFFVAAPESTFDRSLETGDLIPIEERSSYEVSHINGEWITAESGVGFYNPGFDVTPTELIERIFTEDGAFSYTN
jgi:methylthioribose-1-phosphate isomerase